MTLPGRAYPYEYCGDYGGDTDRETFDLSIVTEISHQEIA